MIKLPFIVLLSVFLAACGESGKAPSAEPSEATASAATGEYERGPHKGRMLRKGDFAVEITIFETNEPPHYRLYLYQNDKPLSPQSAQVQITLKRLDGEVNQFSFKPEKDYLKGNGEVIEPHSFDVTVEATQAQASYEWTYDSYEGRTTIAAAAAESAGVKVETVGPAEINSVVRLMGTVALDANRHAQIRARFPGIVRAVNVQQGQRVRRGETLAVVEGNDSMRTYPVVAPFDGIVLARNTSVGDVAGSEALVEMADLSKVWVELRAIGADAEKLVVGQRVAISSATGEGKANGTIQTLLPLATGQSVVARVGIDNDAGRWRPGMTVSADVTLSSRQVPLAVKESALQRFRDFTVVFARVGETYEVRMLELGERDGNVAEVLGGIKPGTPYVTEQSFLIKADVDKSGASHDH